MNRLLLVSSAVAFLLSACSPKLSESVVQTAIAETSFANPPATIQPTGTYTFTPLPTTTSTQTLTPSPTPDIRIINGEPKDFQLSLDDLPREGKYYLPNSNWTSPHTNAEVTAGWTVEKGKEYLKDTGRITGWWIAFARGTSQVSMPEEVSCSVIQYQTAEGAQKAMLKYTRGSRIPGLEFRNVDIKLDLGDANLVEYFYKNPEADVKVIDYFIDFTYKKFLVSCDGYGLEADVSHEFVEDISRRMLNKLKTAELIMPPTATPTITIAP